MHASTWIDPCWEELIRDSEVIGLFRVTEGGLNSGKVKPVRLLRGEIVDGEIELTGFNDMYAEQSFQSEHSLVLGDELYLFLSTNWLYKTGAWELSSEELVAEEWKTRRLFTPTPTTGILPLNEDETVNYGLFTPSYSWHESPSSAAEFEAFILNAVSYLETKEPNTAFHSKLLEQMRVVLMGGAVEGPDLSVLIGMYRLSGGDGLVDIFNQVVEQGDASSRYQMALLLGDSLPSEKAQLILIQLLGDTNTFVQGEAVTQLMKADDQEEVLEILTQKLVTALAGGSGPTNIMEPVLNSTNGGLLSILKVIAEFKYSDAEEELVAVMSNAQDSAVLNASYNALKQIESLGYIEPVLRHLRGSDQKLMHMAIEIAGKEDHEELRLELDRLLLDLPSDSFEVRLIFDNLTIRSESAILTWLERFFEENEPTSWDLGICSNIIDLVDESATVEMKEAVERIMFYWTGVNSDFVRHPSLLTIRRELEANYRAKVMSACQIVFKDEAEVHCLVWIDNLDELMSEQSNQPVYRYSINIVVAAVDSDSDVSLSGWTEAVAGHTKIAPENIGIKYIIDDSFSRIRNYDSRASAFTGWGLVNAYCQYAKRMGLKQHQSLLRYYLESGVAAQLESVDIIRRNLLY